MTKEEKEERKASREEADKWVQEYLNRPSPPRPKTDEEFREMINREYPTYEDRHTKDISVLLDDEEVEEIRDILKCVFSKEELDRSKVLEDKQLAVQKIFDILILMNDYSIKGLKEYKEENKSKVKCNRQIEYIPYEEMCKELYDLKYERMSQEEKDVIKYKKQIREIREKIEEIETSLRERKIANENKKRDKVQEELIEMNKHRDEIFNEAYNKLTQEEKDEYDKAKEEAKKISDEFNEIRNKRIENRIERERMKLEKNKKPYMMGFVDSKGRPVK